MDPRKALEIINPSLNDAADIFTVLSSGFDDKDFGEFYENVKYQGFNRNDFLKVMATKITPKMMVKLSMLGAIRGSNVSKILKTQNLDPEVRTVLMSGIVTQSKPQKSDQITITRCTSALPQWAAYAMLKSSVPSRLPNNTCPSYLQFPAAAALPMSSTLRAQHISFSFEFSQLLPGGEFSHTIYQAMYQNRIPLSEVPAELKTLLGVTRDNDSVVDIGSMLSSLPMQIGQYQQTDDMDLDPRQQGGVELQTDQRGQYMRGRDYGVYTGEPIGTRRGRGR